MGRRLRGRRKPQYGRVTTTRSMDALPLSSESTTDESLGSSSEIPRHLANTANCIMQCDGIPHLQPITSFSGLSGLGNVVLPSGMSAGTSRANIINNSSVIEIIADLLCREREPDPARSKLLFHALCKALKQWNNTFYVPLYSFPELRDFRTGALTRFEFLFKELQNQVHSETENLIIPSLHLPPSGNPLTQLALTDSYEHQFFDDRYSREFKEIELLGKGGFGSVVKAESKLDGRTYAVKIIIMDKKDNETNQKILREVKALAQLEHPNIVRYHTSWLQLYAVPSRHCPQRHSPRQFRGKVKNNLFSPSKIRIQELSSDAEPEDLESSGGIDFLDESKSNRASCVPIKVSVCDTIDETGESSLDSRSEKNVIVLQKKGKQIQDKLKLNINSKLTNMPSTSSHLFRLQHSNSLMKSEKSYSIIRKEFSSSQNDLSFLDDDTSICGEENLYASSSSTDSDNHLKNSLALYQEHPRETQMTLFIQMGLCGQTLAKWISIRNTDQAAGIGFDAVNSQLCLEFFKQILLAVQDIHSKKIIHRDLKPPNILFTEDRKHIKLGDFGLARPMLEVVDGSETNAMGLSLTLVSSQTANTGGVGTPIYAPPELNFGGIYGSKSDMYNLGIIFLELYHPFQTGSERYDMISKLKNHRYLDPELVCRWPEIASLILKLTDHDQTQRPSAAELLASISGLEKLDNSSRLQKNGYKEQHSQFNRSNTSDDLNIGISNLNIYFDETSGSRPPEMYRTAIESQIVKELLNENNIKDEKIKILKEESEKLRLMVAQLQEQINQSPP